MNHVSIVIPHGYFKDGKQIVTIQLRNLIGYDEQYLADNIGKIPLPLLTTELLERVTLFEKIIDKADARKIVQNLTVGDRVVLMLNLRKLTFGNRIPCVLSCPSCNESLSIDLFVDDLLQNRTLKRSKKYHDFRFLGYVLRIRPVRGTDLEQIRDVDNQFDRMEKITRSCIVSCKPPLPDSKMSEDFLDALSSKLEELDPFADFMLNLKCPSCGDLFETSFVAEDYFFQEINATTQQLELEVNWLAMNYHWGEKEILSLSRNKRKRYVELINNTISEQNL